MPPVRASKFFIEIGPVLRYDTDNTEGGSAQMAYNEEISLEIKIAQLKLFVDI
jgi:hypothetical protein